VTNRFLILSKWVWNKDLTDKNQKAGKIGWKTGKEGIKK
jgi:hypothetical protein